MVGCGGTWLGFLRVAGMAALICMSIVISYMIALVDIVIVPIATLADSTGRVKTIVYNSLARIVRYI